MSVEQNKTRLPLLAPLTTLGLGGPAPSIDVARSVDDVAELVGRRDVFILGGGSNVVIADEGIDRPVVQIALRGIDISTGRDAVAVPMRDAIATIAAGEDWDAAVAYVVDQGWSGVETLSGIPGLAGATPIQNVGAYGTEMSDVLVSIQVFDRRAGLLRTMTLDELQLGYRSSALRGTERAVVTAVRIHLTRRPRPVRYRQLADALGIEVGKRAPADEVRAAVLDLRRSKGMVIDAADPDSRSAGSFFTNPVLPAADLAQVVQRIRRRCGQDVSIPQYAAEGGTKLSAAWLIEQAGFRKGFPRQDRPDARIAVSTKHTLALTNWRDGTTAELLSLAREIRDGVYDAFGVVLRPEPMLIGVDWEDPPG